MSIYNHKYNIITHLFKSYVYILYIDILYYACENLRLVYNMHVVRVYINMALYVQIVLPYI